MGAQRRYAGPMTLPPAARRSAWIKVRCSPAELLHLRDAAAHLGLTLAAFCRRRLFGDVEGLPRPGARRRAPRPDLGGVGAELTAAAARAEREHTVAEVLAARGEGDHRGR